MSKLADVAYDIEQLYIEGLHPTMIAKELDIPLSMVYDWLEQTNLDDEEDTELEAFTMDEVDSPYYGA